MSEQDGSRGAGVGRDREGHDADGHDADGHDADGHDTDGHDTDGHDTDGHDTDGPGTDGPGRGGHDYDVVVVGSGFGGSVAALRLAEKGYRVLVLEAGRRFRDEDHATTSWRLSRYLWAPRLRWYGIQRIHLLANALLLAGAGVGGGSLVYANVLYVPPEPFFTDPQWSDLTDWAAELAPHFARATRMLGVVEENPCDGPVEDVVRAAARSLGVEHTVRRTPVGVFFGRDGAREPNVTVPDPYFGGAGPDRTGCTECGNCMVGCRVGAKNTLVKNYLALAERLGVRIEPLRTVADLRPVDPADPGRGWRVTSRHTGAWWGGRSRTVTAGHVVLAAGAWGTQNLLHRLKADGVLPGLSDRLGDLTRTNSEALFGAMTRGVSERLDLTRGVAITTSFHADEHTHVENVRYGRGSNAMGMLVAFVADRRPGGAPGGGSRTVSRRLRRGRRVLRFLVPPPVWRFSQRTVIGLVMQPLDNSLTVRPRRRRLTRGWKLTSRQGHGAPNPAWTPAGYTAIRRIAAALAERTGRETVTGAPVTDLVDVPMTAHFFGGCVIGSSPERGVIDGYHRVWGYPGLHVVDGSALSANLGVNPSLTITAQAERVFSLWPNLGEPDPRPAPGDAYRRLSPVPAAHPVVPPLPPPQW